MCQQGLGLRWECIYTPPKIVPHKTRNNAPPGMYVFESRFSRKHGGHTMKLAKCNLQGFCKDPHGRDLVFFPPRLVARSAFSCSPCYREKPALKFVVLVGVWCLAIGGHSKQAYSDRYTRRRHPAPGVQIFCCIRIRLYCGAQIYRERPVCTHPPVFF